jgi:hypothetical protein
MRRDTPIEVEMTDSNSNYRVRLAAILDVVVLVGFFVVIGIMAAKVH